jgi:hypothetical protein
MDIKVQQYFLIKHSALESDQRWWFLDEVGDIIDFSICNNKYILEDMKNLKIARFVKRYASEEELDIDATIRYGDQCEIKCIDNIG